MQLRIDSDGEVFEDKTPYGHINGIMQDRWPSATVLKIRLWWEMQTPQSLRNQSG